MIATWRDSWFEEGSRLIYIVPPPVVDAILPLQIDPVPTSTQRVFVGRIELITRQTLRSVETAFATRDCSVTDRYGRFLDPIPKRLSLEKPADANLIERFRASVQSSLTQGACR